MKKSLLALVMLGCVALRADAEVVGVITRRADIGTSGYEKIVGTIHFALDPADARNRVIVDLDKAPKGANGRVEFSADLYILRPKDAARSNGVALVEVSNRGNKGMLSLFSRATSGGLDPSTDADLGDGFLTKQGYTLVWVGWQFDVVRQGGRMSIDAPIAAGVSALVKADFTLNQRTTETLVSDLTGYTPVDANGLETTLTVRDGLNGDRRNHRARSLADPGQHRDARKRVRARPHVLRGVSSVEPPGSRCGPRGVS